MNMQMKHLTARALRELGQPAAPCEAAQLGPQVDEQVGRMRQTRRELARERLGWRLSEAIDRHVRTEEREHIDDPEFPEQHKLFLARYLHHTNRIAGSYRRFEAQLEPLARAIARREGRPARVLELAGGSGELSMFLARSAGRVPWEITGSDIVAGTVDDASRRARAASLPVQFRRVDALRCGVELEPGSYDLVVMVDAMHHFTPGQLAQVIAGVGSSGAKAFVGIDVRRGPLALLALSIGGAVTGRRWLLHDALVSARRFYAEPELEFIACLAAPNAWVRVETDFPGYSVLTATFG